MEYNLDEALAKANRARDVMVAVKNPYALYILYNGLKKDFPGWAVATAFGNKANEDCKKIEKITYIINDCLGIFKRKYVESIENMLDLSQEGSFEKGVKEAIDSILKKSPDKKQFFIDEHTKDIANFDVMWILYDTIKQERNQRALEYHRKMMDGIHQRILEYLKNYKT